MIVFVRFDVQHRFVEVWVKIFAEGFETLHTVLLQCVEQLIPQKRQSLAKRLEILRFRGMLQCTIDPVQKGENVANQGFISVLQRLGLLLRRTLPVIVEIGGGTDEFVIVGRSLGLFRRQPFGQFFDTVR